ncbi:hypothetical protein SUGI_0326470 [Cryptomeria japonica]|uniref:uncharacterized protein LOC131074489 n=1 Tax=Cryptomeria japonica TaxID=3369 RepID=UPI002408B377|nr:uncharacterized protein LOC131074489 [Cryptomeria japonica]GLJ18423.1 hypothetical protein SUGI_0326470 [Cryptomeria japonica]
MASQFLFESTTPSLYIQVLEKVVLVSGIVMGFMELKGIHLKYSKFNQGSSSGVQLSSRTAMLIFYLPSFLIAVFFLFCKLLWVNASILLEKLGLLQISISLQLHQDAGLRFIILATAVALHFLKRVFEVLFIHQYSGGITMSTTVIVSFLYSFSSANLLYAMQISEGLTSPSVDLMPLGLVLFVVGISGNLYHHYLLSGLRKKGEKGYVLPKGGLFEFVVCPHYLFEIIGFLGIAFISQTAFGFCQFSFVFLYLLARSLSTREWYVKKFEGFPSHRKALVPFII